MVRSINREDCVNYFKNVTPKSGYEERNVIQVIVEYLERLFRVHYLRYIEGATLSYNPKKIADLFAEKVIKSREFVGSTLKYLTAEQIKHINSTALKLSNLPSSTTQDKQDFKMFLEKRLIPSLRYAIESTYAKEERQALEDFAYTATEELFKLNEQLKAEIRIPTTPQRTPTRFTVSHFANFGSPGSIHNPSVTATAKAIADTMNSPATRRAHSSGQEISSIPLKLEARVFQFYLEASTPCYNAVKKLANDLLVRYEFLQKKENERQVQYQSLLDIKDQQTPLTPRQEKQLAQLEKELKKSPKDEISRFLNSQRWLSKLYLFEVTEKSSDLYNILLEHLTQSYFDQVDEAQQSAEVKQAIFMRYLYKYGSSPSTKDPVVSDRYLTLAKAILTEAEARAATR